MTGRIELRGKLIFDIPGFFLFVYGVSRLANVPFKMLLRGLKPLRLILILTFLLNLFFTTGESVWVEFWIIKITKEGFLQALFYSLRLAFLVVGTSLLT